MSGIGIEWIVTLLFLLRFIGMVVAEIMWLMRKGWATSGKAAAYVILTDMLGFGIGGLVVLGVMMALLMMTFGPSGRGSDAPEAAYIAAIVLGLIIPPVILIFAKRIMLGLFKMSSGKSAWIYSLVSTLAILLAVLVPPPVVLYILGSATSWK